MRPWGSGWAKCVCQQWSAPLSRAKVPIPASRACGVPSDHDFSAFRGRELGEKEEFAETRCLFVMRVHLLFMPAPSPPRVPLSLRGGRSSKLELSCGGNSKVRVQLPLPLALTDSSTPPPPALNCATKSPTWLHKGGTEWPPLPWPIGDF